MNITTDFECGGGKRLEQVAPGHWRVEANGDGSGYDKYFCVRINSQDDEPKTVIRLDVHPDRDLGEAGARFFASHFPSHIWYSVANWQRWLPLRNTWEDAVTFHDDFIELRIPVAPGTEMHVATNVPLRYSDLLQWIDTMGEKHDGLQIGSIGRSVEDRDIPVLRLPGARNGLPKMFVFAAQHPSEHGGNWACEGIVEYALSTVSDARVITDNFDLAVVPMINPDGNVRGLSGANAEDINMFPDFAGAAAGTPATAHENRLLWQWLCSDFVPDVIVHFHGYMGWRRHAVPPYDGIYLLQEADELYTDPERLSAYWAIRDRLAFETPAYTAAWHAGPLDETSIEHQLAVKFQTLSAFYEINTGAVGPFDQYRRGPQVLTAVAKALVLDAGLFT
jgi:hypothetical protein